MISKMRPADAGSPGAGGVPTRPLRTRRCHTSTSATVTANRPSTQTTAHQPSARLSESVTFTACNMAIPPNTTSLRCHHFGRPSWPSRAATVTSSRSAAARMSGSVSLRFA